MNREELTGKLDGLIKQEREIRKQLESFDYEERLANAKKYEGKYFKEIDSHKEHIRCLFVYATDKENCDPIALLISYWADNDVSYFSIEDYRQYNPEKWIEDSDRWIEITADEYLSHYIEVQKRISLALPANK